MKNGKNRRYGTVCAAIGAISWGISGVCGQYLFMVYDTSPVWLTTVRMLFSGILLLLFAWIKNPGTCCNVWKTKGDVGWLLAFAILGLLMCQYTFLSSIKYSNSPTATVLQSLNVIMMVIVMAVWTKKPLRPVQSISVVLAIVGTFLIATGGNLDNMKLSVSGLCFGILSAIGVVTYTLFSRPIIQKHGNIVITGWGMLLGGLFLFFATKTWNIPANMDRLGYFLVSIIVLIGTAGGFAIFLEGVRYAGPVKATLIGCLETVSATVLSILFLHTTFSFYEILGFLCIIATVVLSNECT